MSEVKNCFFCDKPCEGEYCEKCLLAGEHTVDDYVENCQEILQELVRCVGGLLQERPTLVPAIKNILDCSDEIYHSLKGIWER